MADAEYPTRVLLEHRMERLPPVEDAPILAAYHQMGEERFREQFAFDTPLYKNGTVNHRALVRAVRNLVTPGYEWESPFFDEHHLYWPGADYELPTVLFEGLNGSHLYDMGGNKEREYEAARLDMSGALPMWTKLTADEYLQDRIFAELFDLTHFEEFDDTTKEFFTVAEEFRELAMNKLWVPRQFHNFVHTVTLPPEMPEFSVMQRIVRNARRREYLFQVATSAWTITEKLDRSIEMELPKGAGTILLDRKDRRVYQNPEEMEYRREQFIRELITYHQEGKIDLTRLAPMEAVDSRSVEQSLGAIASRMVHSELVKTGTNSRAWRVELPTRNRGHSVWLRNEPVTA